MDWFVQGVVGSVPKGRWAADQPSIHPGGHEWSAPEFPYWVAFV